MTDKSKGIWYSIYQRRTCAKLSRTRTISTKRIAKFLLEFTGPVRIAKIYKSKLQ